MKKTPSSSVPNVWQVAIWLCQQRMVLKKNSKSSQYITLSSLLQAFPVLQTMRSVHGQEYLKNLAHQYHLFTFDQQKKCLQIPSEMVLATLRPVSTKLISNHRDRINDDNANNLPAGSLAWFVNDESINHKRKKTLFVDPIALRIQPNIPFLKGDQVLGFIHQKGAGKYLSKRKTSTRFSRQTDHYFEPLYWVKRTKAPSVAFLQTTRTSKTHRHSKNAASYKKSYSGAYAELLLDRYRWQLPLVNADAIPSDLYTTHGDHPIIQIEILPRQGVVEPCSARFVAPVNESDSESVMAIIQHRLPVDFSIASLNECKLINEEMITVDRRENLSALSLITIDGEDAKDFDDAVFARKLNKERWELIVAIADVSAFVSTNSALDKDAYERATSVYFPRRVIPMLPPELSEHLCSLRPNVNRAVLCVAIIVDGLGKIESYRFFKGLMKSAARLTYTEVEALLFYDVTSIPQQQNAIKPRKITKKVQNNLQNLREVYHALRHQRQQRGSLEFDSHEWKFRFENNKVVEIYPSQRGQSHQLIEECMIVANVCAAHFLTAYHQPLLYRNHEAPLPEKINTLQQTMKNHGIDWKPKSPISAYSLTKLLEKASTHSNFESLQLSVLRSLKQAHYMPNNIEHFGLGLTYYTHFTSPIRRYPDLLVHRAICNVLEQYQPQSSGLHMLSSNPLPPAYLNKSIQARWQQYGEHCTGREKRADEASRDASNILRCELAQTLVGQSVIGTITTVTSFGLFIQLPVSMADGLLHISALSHAFKTPIQFDAENQCLIADRLQKTFRVGDSLRVWVKSVQPLLRKIDLSLK